MPKKTPATLRNYCIEEKQKKKGPRTEKRKITGERAKLTQVTQPENKKKKKTQSKWQAWEMRRDNVSTLHLPL